MKALFRQLLDTALFNVNSDDNIVLVPQVEDAGPADDAARQRAGGFSIPEDLFPANCRVCRLPGGEAFLQAFAEAILTDKPVRVFLVPPLMSRRDLPDSLRAQYPFMELGEIVLSTVIAAVAPSSVVGALLPGSFLFNESSRKTRDSIAELAAPRLIISHDHPADVFGLDVHSQFRMGSILLEKSGQNTLPVRFFRCPSIANELERAEVLNDFRRLLQQEGGKTRYGYVLRDRLPGGASWHYEAYHSDLARRQQELAHLGGIRRLGDLFSIVVGIQPVVEQNLLTEANDHRGFPVIEARNVAADGTIDPEDIRYRALVPEGRLLRPGDICVRRIQRSESRLVCAEVDDDVAPTTAGNSVIVLRPRDDLPADTRAFFLAYLRSSACAEFLRARGLSLQITANKLLDVPVPVADDALRLAVESLGNAARQFRAWAEEAEAAGGSLFDSQSARNARINALSMGRLAKQRYEAALLVSDFSQRVRTRFPYPVAFRWRTVESQHPNLEGYIQVLECAEVTLTYLAIIALILAQTVQRPIRWLREMAKRISTTGHGTNMGDWVSILQEVGGAAFAGQISETAPFVEVSRFQNDPKVKRSLKLLADWRNDQGHGRGPKGTDVSPAFEKAKSELVILLQAVEFVTDYPLRYVEATRRDTLRKVTRYDFRQLMGDHALVPLAHDESPDAEIEALSLYLMDRTGKLHLLRPLLIGRECPVCHSWSTFFLDTGLKGGKGVVLKSMEHGHTSEDMESMDAFRACGMLI